ncbi:MAG TPA: PP2C family serine/threonine-protein phosphatase [Candidatus Nanopelagicales bacterium]|nr:PP2C family serine/threonine-protein phosphatase [Candidatus Nanopelagicales bacterium]
MALALRSAARSDVGLVRSGNEDSGYAGDSLLIVADGMGGHAAGELASATAIATMSETETTGLGDVEALERLSEAVSIAGERIADLVAAHPEWAGMGTTLTALAWLGGEPARVAVLHVGDSRAYLLRDGEFQQITRDHTYVQTLIDSGRISPEEAAVHPRRNLLMRAIDGVHTAEPDMSVREARAGDRFLVCSDGLSGYVDDDRIRDLLLLADPTAAVTALVDAALEAGAPDNVTCVVADVVAGEEHGSLEPVVVGAAGEPRNRERLPGMAFPIDAQPDARPVLTVNSATGGSTSSVADIYREEQPARHARTNRRWWWIGTALIALAALLGIGLFAAYSASQRQYYVGADGGYVAIFRGLPANVGPFDLHSVEERTELTVDSLPDFEAMQVQSTIQTDSLAAAEQVVQRLTERAAQCAAVPTTPGCPDVTGAVTAPTAPAPTASSS